MLLALSLHVRSWARVNAPRSSGPAGAAREAALHTGEERLAPQAPPAALSPGSRDENADGLR
jgi:hypothetical protein